MIPELGQIALLIALALSIIQAIFPLVGAQRGMTRWMMLAFPAAQLQLVFVATAFGLLTYSFLTHDFSVRYVAQNSNTQLPTQYLFSAVWGGHEGSLLLWALTLSLWTGAVTLFSRSIPLAMISRVIGVMGLIAVGFLLFMLLTSNPFDRLAVPPAEGRDLNPLLQDFGLIIHPPMLYMGYVGFVVPFAFAIAAMLGGRLDAAWARWSRPWTNVAWLFLTIGITLGSWWAYYELGWGGWWFWDPVENASFMPWLVGTALMHSLAVTEKRGAFKAWTVLLAILAFSLSLLGTFLVRSGVLTSVHAFASDPERGVFVLMFLVAVVGSSLALYAMRTNQIMSTVRFDLVSRETGLLLNNVLLVAAAASVLIGTLYPLAVDALGIGKISTGPPYFNSVFVPLMAPLVVLVGIGTLARWRRDQPARLSKKLRNAAILALIVGIVYPALFTPQYLWQAAFGMTLAVWVVAATLVAIRERLGPHRNLAHIPRGFWGMVTAHLGVAVFVVGVTLTSLYSTEKDVRLAPGETYEMAGYAFAFTGVEQVKGPNYTAYRGNLVASKNGRQVAEMHPEKRIYLVQTTPRTEAAIDAGLTRDLFVALGEDLGDGAWSLRIHHKPFVRWLWLGALMMAIGGGLAATDRRYRDLARRTRQAGAGAAEAPA
ncbi:heme lyase CcmF/NrfE family subunit [Halochromatium glycolicum]|uniref:C-type cytochrome biogenesis protein CcmF n=1 Tax=Halochromatium glycolicum TaxID=85075 RepID=A0AAJ0U4C4_9GAMM|nr:c-type cytochrome biogenesis protein CcmF [Halochromatium glycolicum]